MRRGIFALIIAAVLLSPALPAAAKALDASTSAENAQTLSWLQNVWAHLPNFFDPSSSPASSSSSSSSYSFSSSTFAGNSFVHNIIAWLAAVNAWFTETLGINLYTIATTIGTFLLVSVRILIRIVVQIFQQLRAIFVPH